MIDRRTEITPPDFEEITQRFLLEICNSEEFGNVPAKMAVMIAHWSKDAAQNAYREGINDGRRLEQLKKE